MSSASSPLRIPPVLKRILAVLTTAVLALGLAVGVASPASAHDANYTATCASLDLNLVSYGGGNNYVTVTIDGTKVEDRTRFSHSFTKSFAWSTTAAHTYKIEIDAADAGYDRLGVNAITGTSTPCAPADGCVNPMSALKGFTVLTSGDATVGSTGEFEGSLAVGGNLSYGTYNLNANKDGSPLPKVDGDDIQLFVGGTVNISAGKFDVNAGWTRITDTTGLTIKESTRLSKAGLNGYVLTQGGGRQQTTISGSAQNSYTATPGAFAAAFPASAFSSLAASSASLAASTAGATTALVTANSASPERTITLTSGKTNVWNVTASALASLTAVNFANNVRPSASTPLVINVTDDASGTVKAVRLNLGDVALSKYVLWNFNGWSTLTVQDGGSFNGSILAPTADLSYRNNSELNGQIAAKTFTITTSAEIHHYAYLPCVTQPKAVTGAATATAQVCDTTVYALTDGSITATAKTGVTYELWNAAKSAKIAGLTAGTPHGVASGTYFVKVLPASSAYTVSTANTWIELVVGAYTGDCTAPKAVSGAASASAEYCDATDYEVKPGSVTATVKTGVKYELWDGAKSAKIADFPAGTAYPVSDGTYFVKVLPVSSAFTVSTANTWIELVVGAHSDICAESVTGAAIASAEICEAGVYEVKQGSVTATVKTGVKYELWNADKSAKIVDLAAGTPYRVDGGTYFVKVVKASDAYQVLPENEWIQVVVGTYTGLCAQDVSGSASASAEYCDAGVYEVTRGSVTATTATGIAYELWDAARSTKLADLTAGTPHPVAAGTYFVKVLPASSKYVVSAGNTWIELVVGEYTGVCAEGVAGSATAAAEVCDTTDYEVAKGTVTAHVATGVTYELWNSAKSTKIANLTAGTAYPVAAGTYFVKVLPASSKYDVSAGNTWIELVVGRFAGVCAEDVSGSATSIAEICDADFEITRGSVTAGAATGVVYELWNSAKTGKIADLTAGAAHPITGGTYFVKVLPASSKHVVSSANTWIEVVVGDYTGLCAEPVSGAATTASEICDPADLEVGKGSITATAATGVTYELWDAAKAAKIADLTAGSAYPAAGGTYFVKVLPVSSKYTVSAGDTWIQVDVAENSTVCSVIGDPTIFQQCVLDPADLLTSDWTAHLTIVPAANVVYRVYFSDGATWVDQGIWAAGRYDAGTTKLPYDTTVRVDAVAESGWNLLAPKSWTYHVQKAFPCDLTTGGLVEPQVVFTESCAAGASYALSIAGGAAGTVLWSVNGGPETTQLGTFAVASPSTVSIVAKPAPGSGFPGSSGQLDFTRTFSGPAACDLETLALTGQNTTGFALLAIILFQAGLALVAVRFVRARRTPRHVA